MKKIKILFVLLLMASFTFAQDIKVEADKRLNVDFSKYKTFYWTKQVDAKLNPGVYFLNDVVLKDLIRHSVDHELRGMGYKKQANNPDLIVNFRVFDKPTTLKGFTGYGTDYWGTEVRDPASAREYKVQAGTLVVNLLDGKTGEMVWTGFASGLMDGNLFDKKEDKIMQAVNLIFDNYNQRADNYTSR